MPFRPNSGTNRQRLEEATGAEGCCGRCCARCRCSPLQCALIICVCILVAATVVLWLAAATVRNSSASATTDPCVEVLNERSIFITYDDYLGFAGILVIILIFAIAISVFVGIGLTVDSIPRPAKLLAAACTLVPVVALILFMLWLALGTAMAVICPFRPTALFYIALMWFYFLIVVVIGIISTLLLAQSAKHAVQKAIK